jgi:hypothetical protein
VNCERVHAALEFAGKRRVNHAMALEAALSVERRRHDIKSEMSFTAGPVPGMAYVAMRFVLDVQALGRKGYTQLFGDQIARLHADFLARISREQHPGWQKREAPRQDKNARRAVLSPVKS